jgi:hypothetical protein
MKTMYRQFYYIDRYGKIQVYTDDGTKDKSKLFASGNFFNTFDEALHSDIYKGFVAERGKVKPEPIAQQCEITTKQQFKSH